MAAKEIIETIAEAVAEAWGTLFMKKIALQPEELEPTGELGIESGDYVLSSIEFSGDLSGTTKIYLPKTEALTMVGMMMSMGTDDALIDSTREGELEDEQLDAINEAFNQFSATAASVLRNKLDCNVSGSSKPTEKITLESGLAEEGESCKYVVELEGYDQGAMFQTFSSELLEGLNAEIQTDLDDSFFESTPPTESSTPKDQMIDLIRTRGNLKIKTDIVLAERSMEVNQFLSISIGSVIEFWKPCDDPVEMAIGDTTFANGEVVVSQDQHFCLRVIELAPQKRTYQKGTH